jgi:hypothetical protein
MDCCVHFTRRKYRSLTNCNAIEKDLIFRADALKSWRITRQNLPCTFELDV